MFQTQAPAQGQQAPQAQAQPNTNSPLQQQQIDGAPVTPPATDPNAAATPEAPANPLDALEVLWQDKPVDPNAPEGEPQAPTNFLDVNADQMGKVADTMDFTANLPAELAQRIQSGDTNAMLEAINLAGRQSYSAAMQHGAMLANKQLESSSSRSGEASTAQMQDMVNTTLTRQAVGESAYQHPMQQRELNRVSEQIRKQYPDAQPNWVASQAQEYMRQLSDSFTGAGDPTKPAQAPNPQDINWDEFAAEPSDDGMYS